MTEKTAPTRETALVKLKELRQYFAELYATDTDDLVVANAMQQISAHIEQFKQPRQR